MRYWRERRREIETKNRYGYHTLEVILNSIADGVFTVNKDFIITSFNPAAEEITGIMSAEALGRPCHKVFRADICEANCALKHSIETGQPLMRYPISIIRADGKKVCIAITASALRDDRGELEGGVETFRDLSLIEEMCRKFHGVYSLEDMVSRNVNMREIFSILPRIAKSDSTVLIQGESGTGKDMIANALHRLSHREKGPMVVVNCGALPDTLLESELFGYAAGAFTDAKKDKPGRFSQADGGTIFLDEIGDVSPAMQAMLLRVLQERCFEPLGSTKTVKTNVRVLAATNKDLTKEVHADRFRRDLYYRVNVIQISLPPLRDRKEDIPLIVNAIIQKMNRVSGKSIKGLSQKASQVFLKYDWPGNIRELENALEHGFILCESGQILCNHLPDYLPRQKELEEVSLAGKTLQEIEAQAIFGALVRNNWNKSLAAKELGLNNSTIWRKCKRLGLAPP
jgi:PAS domain S-box-containing protein